MDLMKLFCKVTGCLRSLRLVVAEESGVVLVSLGQFVVIPRSDLD